MRDQGLAIGSAGGGDGARAGKCPELHREDREEVVH